MFPVQLETITAGVYSEAEVGVGVSCSPKEAVQGV